MSSEGEGKNDTEEQKSETAVIVVVRDGRRWRRGWSFGIGERGIVE